MFTLLLQVLLTTLLPIALHGGMFISNPSLARILLAVIVLCILAQIWLVIYGVGRIRVFSKFNPLLASALVAGAGQSLRGYRSWALYLNLSLLITSTITINSFIFSTPIQYVEKILPINPYIQAFAGVFDRYQVIYFGVLVIIWGPLYLFNIWDCFNKDAELQSSLFRDLFMIMFSFIVPGIGNAYIGRFKSAFVLLTISFTGAAMMQFAQSEGMGWLGLYLSLIVAVIAGIWGAILLIINRQGRERAKLAAGLSVILLLVIGVPQLKYILETELRAPFLLLMDEEGNYVQKASIGGGNVCQLSQGGYAITQWNFDSKERCNYINLFITDGSGYIITNKEILRAGSCTVQYIAQTNTDELIIIADELEKSKDSYLQKNVPQKMWLIKTDLQGNIKAKNLVAQWFNKRQIYMISYQPDGCLNIICTDDYEYEYSFGAYKICFEKVDLAGNQTVVARTEIRSLPKPPKFIRTSGGDYVCAASDKIVFTMFDSNGNKYKEISSPDNIEVIDLKETYDGGFIIAGNTFRDVNNFELRDLVVFKTDSNGNIEWKQRYNTEKTFDKSGYGHVSSITQLPDESYMIVSNFGFIARDSIVQPNGVRVLKIDTSGNKVWEKDFGNRGTGNKLLIKSFKNSPILVLGQ